MWNMAQSFWRIFSSKQRLNFCFLIILMAVTGLLEAIGIGAILPLVSFLGDPTYLQKYYISEHIFTTLGASSFISQITWFCLGLILFYLVKNFLIIWVSKKQYDFSIELQNIYEEWLLAYYLHKPYLFHVNSHSATLISNMSRGLAVIFNSILPEYFHLSAELITAFMIWLLLVYLDWFTASVVAGFFAVVVYLVLRAIRHKSIEAGRQSRYFDRECIRWLEQSLAGIKETKIGQKENFFVKAYSKANAKVAESEKVRLLLGNMPRTAIEIIVIVALILLTLIKLWQGETGTEIVPLLGVLALAAFRLMPCANRSVISFNAIKYHQSTFNEIYPDLINARKLAMAQQQKRLTNSNLKFEHEIYLQNLSFGYEKNKKLWLGVDLHIKKGDFVGVIGPSGAGKTTFLDVFLGLLTPNSGTILVDGKDVFTDLPEWQGKFGYVSQNIYLMDGTVCDNVAFGEEPGKVSKERVWQALQMAELASLVQQLPKGLNSEIGEYGLKFSGGQRQRLGIARALYKQPEILVLDEATSSLDGETEKAIVGTLLKLRGKITIISVAHRVSTLVDCDYKLCVDKRKISIENGKK
jgi:ATP-binding cassette subfamily C protein